MVVRLWCALDIAHAMRVVVGCLVEVSELLDVGTVDLSGRAVTRAIDLT